MYEKNFNNWASNGIAFVGIMAVFIPEGSCEDTNIYQTCEEISITSSGRNLVARCKGSWRYEYGTAVSINIDRHIGNSNGSLVWGGTNYQDSCKDISLKVSPMVGANVHLSAKCDTGKQGWNKWKLTGIGLEKHIVNRNGNLVPK